MMHSFLTFILFILLFPMNAESQGFPTIADKYVRVNGIRMAYKDEGIGRTVLCLHALGHSSSDFASLYGLPPELFRVISVDLPGQGGSGQADGPVTSQFYYEVISAFIAELGLRDIILVGNSIGGAVAIRLAAENPLVTHLLLSNPAGLDKRDLVAPLFLDHMIRSFKKGVAGKPGFGKDFAAYYAKVLPDPRAEARRKEIVADGYRLAPLLVEGWRGFKRADEDLRPLIGKVTCPVLFTWAMKDRYVRFSRNRKAIARFHDHRLLEYPIGHTPYLECPETFLADLREFVAQPPAAIR